MNRKKIVRKKTAILVVSYGCNHERMRAKTIGRIEADIQKAYPEYLISHAWTSQIIRRKCFEQERIRIPGVKEAMEELFRRGIQQVVVQQTHLLNGLENRRMIEDVETFAEDFSQLIIGAPLLASYEDKRKVIHIIEEEIRLKNGEALALVGHGLKGGEEETLGELGAMFRELGYEDIFLGSMEGQVWDGGVPGALSYLGQAALVMALLYPFFKIGGLGAGDVKLHIWRGSNKK